MKYVFIDTDNGGTPANATPDTSTSRYHTTSSWPANGARWSSLNTALNNSTITGIADDITVYCRGATDENAKVVAPSSMTCASLTIIGDWVGGAFDDSKYHINYTGALGLCFENLSTSGNVTFRLIQCTYNGSTASPTAVRHSPASGSTNMYVDRVLVRLSGSGTSGGTSFRKTGAGSGVMYCYNCIAYPHGSPGGTRHGFDTVTAYNCIAFGFSGNGYTLCTTINCIAGNNTSTDFNACTATYCASDDVTSGTGNVNGRTWSNEFTDFANSDFTLKSGSTLIGIGLDDPAGGAFSIDVVGTARSDWDIGPFEYVTSGLTITSITPSQIDSGESFTITGAGFGSTQGLSLVQIGGVTQTPTSWSDSSITCTATRGSQSMGNATLTIYKM